VIKSKKRKCVEERFVDSESKIQWIETIKTPVFDDQGKVIGTAGIARDITQRKKDEEKIKETHAELELRVKIRTAELTGLNEELRKEISERKVIELGLIESEIKFKTMFEAVADGMVIVDTATKNIFLSNSSFFRMSGYSLEELQKMNIVDLHPKEEMSFVLKQFERLLKKDNAIAENIPIKRKDGSIFYADISGAPLFLSGKKYILGNFRDVTQRQEVEKNIMQLVSLQNATLEATADGILVVGKDGVVSIFNQKFLELWNISNDLIQLRDEKKLLDYVAQQLENPEEFLKKVQDLYVDQGKSSLETLKFKNGRVFERYSQPHKINDTIVGRVWSFRDVTDYKVALEKLRLNEEKFRTVAEFTYDWEYWQGVDKQMLYISPSCQLITGYSQADFIKNPDLLEKIVYDDDLPIFCKMVKNAVDESSKLEFDFRIVRKDKQVCWISHICVPVYDDSGKLIGRRASNRDITEKKEYEAQLRAYRDKLEVLVEERTKSLELEIGIRKAAELNTNALNKQIEFILGTTKTGLDIIDKDYNIRYIDSEWASRYGDWRGKKCFEYFMDRKSPCSKCAIDEALRTKNVVISEEVLFKEGNRPIQVTTIPFQDSNGEWLVAEVNVDITQKKKTDEEILKYRSHLEQLVDERTQELLQETVRYKNSELEKSKLNTELLKTNKKLKSVSLVDPHTGLYNYRYLQEIIEAEFHQARRYAQNLAIIMLDIDYFKSINEVYGIAFGDLVLKQFSRQLKRMVRRYDILIRYSGEEFIIISPRLDRDVAFNMSQRLLESLNFVNFGNSEHTVKLKISVSVVSSPEDRVKNGMDLVNLANKILIKVKEGGGNRVYSTLDLKSFVKKGSGKITKAPGVESLKKTIDKLERQSKQGLSESIFAFAKTLELKDHYTGEHVENTVHFATELAKGLDLPKEDIELIKQAAMLHDLGKIGISESILLKKGKLNRKEFDEIKKHPQIGADIIRPIQFLHSLIPFIFYHHERWDGKGYPGGIKGEDIPLGARIIAIADVYQALTSDRPYHKAFTKKDAMNIIKKASGTQFDPRIVKIFLKIIDKKG
ncbi:MAG: PAS domain S-box protein, partial [Candidatus Omnitrophota bacterium]